MDEDAAGAEADDEGEAPEDEIDDGETNGCACETGVVPEDEVKKGETNGCACNSGHLHGF